MTVRVNISFGIFQNMSASETDGNFFQAIQVRLAHIGGDNRPVKILENFGVGKNPDPLTQRISRGPITRHHQLRTPHEDKLAICLAHTIVCRAVGARIRVPEGRDPRRAIRRDTFKGKSGIGPENRRLSRRVFKLHMNTNCWEDLIASVSSARVADSMPLSAPVPALISVGAAPESYGPHPLRIINLTRWTQPLPRFATERQAIDRPP